MMVEVSAGVSPFLLCMRCGNIAKCLAVGVSRLSTEQLNVIFIFVFKLKLSTRVPQLSAFAVSTVETCLHLIVDGGSGAQVAHPPLSPYGPCT